MGRVFVAGSINMDVVATAERHPRIGETVAGNAVLYFPGGKGASQAVAAAKLGAPFHQARAAGATTILNPAPAIESKRELLDLVDILILNESELGFLAESELHDTDDHAVFIEAARSLQTGKDKNHLRDIG